MTTLDELRRADMQEQRKNAEAASAQPAPPVTSAPAPEPVKAKAEPPKAAAVVQTPEEAPAPAVPHLNGNGHMPAETELVETAVEVVPDPVVAETSTAAVETEPAVDEADRKARAIMDRFYRGLAHKVVHPTGVKATVDMPPDLFWRVKRYCHDHNNVTVRQLFLDLVIAVLEEEGY